MNENIIFTSILDNDLYTFTVGQLAFHLFSDVVVSYDFINRGNTNFPPGFADVLRTKIVEMKYLQLTTGEINWLKTLPYFRSNYIEWLSQYHFNPDEVFISQSGGNISIKIYGPWYRTIFWEVPLLALISELYFVLTSQYRCKDWDTRISIKSIKLNESGCWWADFGTRRRFSWETQSRVVEVMKHYRGFIGTSNSYFAYKYGITPVGTMSHQLPMILSAIFGVEAANKKTLELWKEIYGKDLLIFLPDTFGTDVFLRDFDYDTTNVWNGLRQDSGCPNDWMDNKVIPHYERLGISLKKKTIIFSDNLNDEKFIQLSTKYKNISNIIGGIGTFLTNDVFSNEQKTKGIKPLNMVIKAVKCGDINIVKLSDVRGKYTGDPQTIELVKRKLNI